MIFFCFSKSHYFENVFLYKKLTLGRILYKFCLNSNTPISIFTISFRGFRFFCSAWDTTFLQSIAFEKVGFWFRNRANTTILPFAWHEDFFAKNCFWKTWFLVCKTYTVGVSFHMNFFWKSNQKDCLVRNDDKRVIFEDGIHTLAYRYKTYCKADIQIGEWVQKRTSDRRVSPGRNPR